MNNVSNFFDVMYNLMSAIEGSIGLDGFKDVDAMDVDEPNVNLALALMQESNLGKGNNYNHELEMAFYLGGAAETMHLESMREKMIAYANFLMLDAHAKYIVERVRQKGYMGENVLDSYSDNIDKINKYVRIHEPINVFEESIEKYLEICYLILGPVMLCGEGCVL